MSNGKYDVLDHVATTEERLTLYAQCINKIDDYFEYAYRSTQDRQFVIDALDTLTKQLAGLEQ